MKVTINGKTYVVFWQYKRKGDRLKFTRCFIKEQGAEDPLVEAKATCYKGDCPRKNTGRKLSLARALHAVAQFTKEQRTMFWDAYKEMKHGNWLDSKNSSRKGGKLLSIASQPENITQTIA